MKNAQLLKVYDLIREIQDVDNLIRLHQDLSNDRFMTDQYLARKDKLFASLLVLVAKPTLASSTGYRLISQLVEKYYTADMTRTSADAMRDEWRELEQLTL